MNNAEVQIRRLQKVFSTTASASESMVSDIGGVQDFRCRLPYMKARNVVCCNVE